jgi:hypothetical protein
VSCFLMFVSLTRATMNASCSSAELASHAGLSIVGRSVCLVSNLEGAH